ncbi:MAG: signal peptidase II [Synechococcales bacterium]|nr:signal peptidase II [Synechococcales bacterium]
MKNRSFWIAASAGLALDRVTKLWVLEALPRYETIPILRDMFHFTHVVNTGAAFSLFAGQVNWLRWLSLGVSVLLVGVAVLGPRLSRWEQVGYGLVMSGALGNGIDRFAFGHVIDFLDFRLIQFPVFNLADVFINAGIACLLIASLQKPSSIDRSVE